MHVAVEFPASFFRPFKGHVTLSFVLACYSFGKSSQLGHSLQERPGKLILTHRIVGTLCILAGIRCFSGWK